MTISGSLPQGLAPGYYQALVEIGRDNGIPVIVDTSGGSLRQVLVSRVKPFTIKPNLTELSQLLGKAVEPDECSLKQALADELFRGIEMIVVSLGADGAFVKHGKDYYRATIPKIEVVNPVGSGDATVAGLAVALSQRLPIVDVLKTAMTTGMLNTMEAGTGMIDYTKFGQFFELVQVTKLD